MFGNIRELPRPLGQFTVGLTEMDFEDEKRKGIFEFAKDEVRKIPIMIFYPADSTEGKQSSPYSFKEAIEFSRKSALNLISSKMADIKTHCYENVKVSSKQENFPVIFFNPGYFSYIAQNVVLCSDLASKGYVVMAVGHPYETGAVKYQDGQVIKSNNYLLSEFKKTMTPEAKKKFKNMMKREYSDEEIITISVDFFKDFASSTVWNNVKIWAEDTVFIADQLEKLNNGHIPSQFENKLNLELGFGITGHSYGGCTAMQVCLDDSRFKCGVNIDAPTYGDYWDKDIKKPLMVIGSKIIQYVARTNFLYDSEDALLVTISDTEHMDYTDYNYFARQLKLLKLLGKREMNLIRDALSSYHIAFFDKYLLGNENSPLLDLSFQGVKVRSRIKNLT